jgi:plasmid replication initiation protein
MNPPDANRFEQSLSQLQAKSAARQCVKPPDPAPKPAKPQTSLRPTPRGDAQGDFFVPALYDIGTKDHRGVMDVAVFRLSKRDKRADDLIRYELPGGFVEVSSGRHGMASVWDYDIVLMAVSQLTNAMDQFRKGQGEKPPQSIKAHVADILKFCRREPGGKQKTALVGALSRLSTTLVVIERPGRSDKGLLRTVTEGETLISWFRVISHPATGRVEEVEIKIADWMYKEITQGHKPDVLTVHPNYFLIESAIGRFVYRLARMAARHGHAWWGFELLHQRSGSNATTGEFNRMLRVVIESNDLPEYSLTEKAGKQGPVLVMTYRDSADHLKVVLKEDEWDQSNSGDDQ